MASKTIKGLTVEIGGNTTELQKALKEAETHSNSLGRELSDVNKLLKFDPDNVDKLVQKQQILTERVAATKEKLDVLKEAEAQVQEQFEKGQINAEQMRAFQREIMYTENQMHGYEKAIEETVKQLDTARVKQGEAISSFGMLKTAIAEQEKQLAALKDKYKDTVHAEGENSTATRELKSEYDKLNAELTENKSKLKEVEKAADTLGQTENAALKPLNELKSRISEQEKTLSELTKTYQSTVLQYGKNSAEAQKLAANIRQLSQEHTAAKSKLSELEKAAKSLVPTEKSLTERLSDQKQELEKLKTQYVNTAAQYGKNSTEAKNLKKEILTLVAQINAEEKAVESTTKEIADMTGESSKAAKKLDDVGDSARKAESGLSAAAVAAGTFIGNLALDILREAVSALRDIAGNIMETGMDFEASMSNVKAISGATDKQLEMLTETAREYGRTTSFTAAESADALQYMALAGWEVEDMTAALPGVLNLAAASQMDLGQASDIVTDYLTAFGKEAGYATTFVDQMAYTMSTSNMTTEMLGEAYKGCAATAHSLGYSIEETTAVLGTMANAGVKGGEAGTALNAIMTRLATDTNGVATSLKKYGVQVFDEKGNMQSLSSVLQGVSDAWGMLTEQEQASLAKSIAGTNHYAALQTIMAGLSDEAAESGKGFADYAEALKHAGGTAEAMAETQLDNLRGDLTKLGSAWSDLEIEIYNGANAPMRDVVQLITNELMPALSDVVTGTEGAGTALGEALSNVLTKILKSLTDALPEVVDTAYVLVAGFLQSLTKALPDVASAAASLVTKIADAIVESLPNLLDVLPGIVDVAITLVETLADVILENLPVLLEACGLLINTIVARLPSLLQTLLEAIVQNLPLILTTLFTVLQSIVETLTQSVSELAPIIKDIVVQLTEMLIKEAPTLLQGAIDLFMAILDAVPVLIEALLPLIPEIVRSVVETLADNFPDVLAVCFELFDMLQQANLDFTQKLIDILITWFDTALSSIADWWKTLKKTVTEIVNSVVDVVKGITSKMRDAGHNILAGLIDGIVGMKAALIQKVTDIASSILHAITHPFEIHSPSRKMAWVGQMIDAGLAEGMEDNADDPLEAMQRMANSILHEAAPLPSEIEAHHTITMQQERTATDTGLLEKLDRILTAVESGKIIAIDGDKIVGATINKINTTLAGQQILDERRVI